MESPYEARSVLESIIQTAQDMIKYDKDLFLDEFTDEFRKIYFLLDEIVSTPHCDVCGAVDETVEWCGNCGNCVEHCELSDSCDEWEMQMFELRQDGL